MRAAARLPGEQFGKLVLALFGALKRHCRRRRRRRTYQREVDKVQAQLADVGRNHFDFQLAALDVARHQRGEVGRRDVRDVVEHFLVAGGRNCVVGVEESNVKKTVARAYNSNIDEVKILCVGR